MRQKKTSGSSLFLLEILLNILLFSAMLSVCLQFFIKAHRLTGTTRELQRAVCVCANAASVFEAGDGTYDAPVLMYNYEVLVNNQLIVYLDNHFLECPSDEAAYLLTFSDLRSDADVNKVLITCQKVMGNQPLYQVTACCYRALTPYDAGGGAHE